MKKTIWILLMAITINLYADDTAPTNSPATNAPPAKGDAAKGEKGDKGDAVKNLLVVEALVEVADFDRVAGGGRVTSLRIGGVVIGLRFAHD